MEDHKKQLYDKVKPEQIRLLKVFGAAKCFGYRQIAKAAEPDAVLVDASACSEPTCVCGSSLERVDRRTRVERLLEALPGTRSADEHLIGKLWPCITCDICGRFATRSGFGWTCRRGADTILHSCGYDVCEECVALYAGCEQTRMASTAAKIRKVSASNLVSTFAALFRQHAAHGSFPQSGQF